MEDVFLMNASFDRADLTLARFMGCNLIGRSFARRSS
jgi:uncharacterized protein YjbI with pentapeptide repeats